MSVFNACFDVFVNLRREKQKRSYARCMVRLFQAHLQSAPSVPRKCRVILTDYISLVRTRLADLGVRSLLYGRIC